MFSQNLQIPGSYPFNLICSYEGFAIQPNWNLARCFILAPLILYSSKNSFTMRERFSTSHKKSNQLVYPKLLFWVYDVYFLILWVLDTIVMGHQSGKFFHFVIVSLLSSYNKKPCDVYPTFLRFAYGESFQSDGIFTEKVGILTYLQRISMEVLTL